MKDFSIEYTGKNLTRNAGLVNLGRFADKIGLPSLLDRCLTIKRGSMAHYKIAEMVMMLIMGVVAGAKHMNHLVILRADKPIRTLFGWETFPDASTFGKLFKRFNLRHCQELSEAEAEARMRVWSRKSPPRVTLDMDSSIIGVTGVHQGAERGDNSGKSGQKGYHSLLCFIAETTECLHNWFRSGSSYTSNGVVEFLKECYERIPPQVNQVFVRADGGFFVGEILDYLEERKSDYLIKVEVGNISEHLANLKNWQGGKKRIKTVEFMHREEGWSKDRRFVAVRQFRGNKIKDALFPEPEDVFHCYVTNLSISSLDVHQLFLKKSAREHWITWCKSQVASGTIRTSSFWSNSAIFQICILAYNLMVWMLWLTSEKSFNEDPERIRSWFIHVPATVTPAPRKKVLRLSEHYTFRTEWEKMAAILTTLNFDK